MRNVKDRRRPSRRPLIGLWAGCTKSFMEFDMALRQVSVI